MKKEESTYEKTAISNALSDFNGYLNQGMDRKKHANYKPRKTKAIAKEDKKTISLIEEFLFKLEPQDRFLMKARYGLFDRLYSTREIGEELGLTASGVCTREKRILEQLNKLKGR